MPKAALLAISVTRSADLRHLGNFLRPLGAFFLDIYFRWGLFGQNYHYLVAIFSKRTCFDSMALFHFNHLVSMLESILLLSKCK